jgi:hypothetical protein
VVEAEYEYSGPVVEVVVTAQTIIYENVTPEGQIQQIVKPGSLEGLGESSTVMVWGRETGERIIADIFVYTPPVFIK